MSIVTLDQVKDKLNIDSDDTSQDIELQDYLDAVTTPVENQLREIVDVRDFTEDLELHGRVKFRLTNTPIISLASLVSLDGVVTYDVANLKVEPGGLVRVITGIAPFGVFTATYQAGYVTVPANIVQGTLEAIQDVWEDSQRGMSGVSSASRANMEQIRQRLTYVLSYKVAAWLGQPTTMAR